MPSKNATSTLAKRIAEDTLRLFSHPSKTNQLLSQRHPELDIPLAYEVSALLRDHRIARGEKPVGYKIGFTNRKTWKDRGLTEPIWGYVWNTTAHHMCTHDHDRCSAVAMIERFQRPRIEPEIIFGLVKSPSLDMSDSDLWKCIGWISHGFEIVESVFPGWSFTPADAVAVGGLHAELYIGRKTWTNGWPDPNKPSPADANTSDLAEPNMFVPPTAGDSDSQGHLDRQRSWEKMLEQFQIELRHNDRLVAEGCGSDVLGSPLTALRHLVELVARSPFNPRLAAGEIVTTGTVTEALPIKSGESWSTRLKDIDLANATLLLRKDA